MITVLPVVACPEAGLALDRELTLTLLTVTQRKAEPARGLKKTRSADDFITSSGVTQSLELEDNLGRTRTKQQQVLTIWCVIHDF